MNSKKTSSNSSYITNPEPSDQRDVKLPIFKFTLNVSNISTETKFFLNFGSQLNLMKVYFVKENNIPYSLESNLPNVSGISGIQSITGKTAPISLKYKNHIYKISFYDVDLPWYCPILGIDWLETSNPTINISSKDHW